MQQQLVFVLLLAWNLFYVDSTDALTKISTSQESSDGHISIEASLTTSSSSSATTSKHGIELEAGSPVVAAYKTLARNVICNMTTAFPALTILSPSPWSCPSTSNITGQWCNFTGISCRPATGQLPAPIYMQYIQLSSTKLKGRIPTALGKLTQLERLVLDSNSIYGTIPSALSTMSSLKALYLNKNSLIGTVPLALTKLTKLQVFNVNFNYMTGTLPSWFATNTYNNDTASGPATYVELTAQPTGQPSVNPSLMPLNSPRPTKAPTKAPSKSPTLMPTATPSLAPSAKPSVTPTLEPSQVPTVVISTQPTVHMTMLAIPTQVPSQAPPTGLSEGKIAAAVVLSIVGAAFLGWFIYKCFIEVSGSIDLYLMTMTKLCINGYDLSKTTTFFLFSICRLSSPFTFIHIVIYSFSYSNPFIYRRMTMMIHQQQQAEHPRVSKSPIHVYKLG